MPVSVRRLYKHLYRKSLNRTHAAILRTRATRCNPDARVELHTLTGHDHLYMYMTMLKSFLRFHDDIAVVAHDGDNTITERRQGSAESSISKVLKSVDKETADKAMLKALAAYPRCLKYRSRIVNAVELLDFNVLAQREKLILVNSDVLFLEKPQRLVDWIMSDSKDIVAVYEERPARQKEDLAILNVDFPAHLTIALMCSHGSLFDPVFVEEVLSKRETRLVHRTEYLSHAGCQTPRLQVRRSSTGMNTRPPASSRKALYSGTTGAAPAFSQVRNSTDARRVIDSSVRPDHPVGRPRG